MTATAYGTAQKGIAPPPIELDDDLYPAHIQDIVDAEGTYQDQSYDQYQITWELDGLERDDGSPLTLLSWIRIPDGLINNGVVNEKSKLYEFLRALGYDDDGLVVDPAEWQGQDCRVVVENREIKTGDNAGQVRPRITGYKTTKKSKPTPKAAARRRRQEENEDEDF